MRDLRTGDDVETPIGTAPTSPYRDIELCFRAERGHLALARSVGAEIAQRETSDTEIVERVRLAVGTVVSAHMLLADEHEEVRCLFRVMESQIRVNVSVRGLVTPTPEAKAQHARLLDQVLVSASTITVPDERGGLTVVTDALIPVDHRRV